MDIYDIVDENDAFLIETKEYNYFYAIIADLNDKGRHYYKINKSTDEIKEVNEDEIVDIILNKKEKILHKCPCIQIENGHLKPLVERK